MVIKWKNESQVTQSCLILCNPWTVAHQAPPSMGFSRQEYWSGLPFPSPGWLLNWGKLLSNFIQNYTIRALLVAQLVKNPPANSGESESESEVTESYPTLCYPMDCSLPGSSIHGIFQARVLEWVSISFSRGSSQPRDPTWVSRTSGRRFTIWATREANAGDTGSIPGLERAHMPLSN